ncbi:hypothetical protein BH23CYA1_BH23CYA1_11330 [soil metagenome]
MRRARHRLRAFALVPVAALILAADLAAPGWGKFPNPIFYARFAANALSDRLSAADTVNPDDARLRLCQGQAAWASTITDAQAALRNSLEGKTSVLAVQSLGSPACQMADGSYRWLLNSGLSLDVTVDKTGVIENATLSR